MAILCGNDLIINGSNESEPVFEFDASMIDVANYDVLTPYQENIFTQFIPSNVEVNGVKCKVAGTNSLEANSDGLFSFSMISPMTLLEEFSIILFVKLIDFPRHIPTNETQTNASLRSRQFKLISIGDAPSQCISFGGCAPFYKNMKTDELLYRFDYSKIALGVSLTNDGTNNIALQSDFVYSPNEWYMLGVRYYNNKIDFSINGKSIYTVKTNRIPWGRTHFRKYYRTNMTISYDSYIQKKKAETCRLPGFKNHNGQKLVASKIHDSFPAQITPNFRFGMKDTTDRRITKRLFQSLSEYGHYKVYNTYISDEFLLNIYNSLKNDY